MLPVSRLMFSYHCHPDFPLYLPPACLTSPPAYHFVIPALDVRRQEFYRSWSVEAAAPCSRPSGKELLLLVNPACSGHDLQLLPLSRLFRLLHGGFQSAATDHFSNFFNFFHCIRLTPDLRFHSLRQVHLPVARTSSGLRLAPRLRDSALRKPPARACCHRAHARRCIACAASPAATLRAPKIVRIAPDLPSIAISRQLNFSVLSVSSVVKSSCSTAKAGSSYFTGFISRK